MTVLCSWDSTGLEFNDIWGYVDGSGNEYAIIGSWDIIHIFQVHSNNTLTQVDTIIPGNTSLWRDFKVYKDTLYAVADKSGTTEGLVTIDLSTLPDSVSLVSKDNSVFSRAHNIFIDEANAKLYVTGSNTKSNGLHIYDLTPHPDTVLASVSLISSGSTPGYAHDIYVRDDTVYASHGYDGFYVWNCSNPTNPILLGSKNTGGYNHSSWVTANGKYAYYAEEVPIGLPMGVLDLSGIQNGNSNPITPVNTFKFPLLAPTHMDNRPHNPFLIGDSLYVSYYHDGIQVFDVSNPTNVTQEAYFDTYPSNTTYSGYEGAWGTYPFLPSGKILVSDISNGLIVTEIIPPAPLPVELANFNAKVINEKVMLSWTTLSETNNAFFEIEKSLDGRDFISVKKILGAGTSTLQNNYEAWDNQPFRGENYYRLKQVDTDGKYSYSNIEFIFVGNDAIKIYPTLVSNDSPLQIELPDDPNSGGVLRILNINGLEVFHKNLNQSTSYSIPISFLKNGLYVIHFQNERMEKITRLTVLK